ncbi:MAG: rod shape-determining protein MreC [Eubacteriales bacterium]|nr:rod shape-determining protein MreC [Eubacteriales bacterium]
MKEFLKSRSMKIFMITIFVVIVLAVFTNSIENNFVSSTINGVTYPLSKVSAAATNDDDRSIDEIKAENEKLKKENADLRSQLVNYYDVLTENSRLWKFYDLKKENPQYSLVPCTVLRRDSNDDFYSFTIDKGTTSDISVNDPVVSENGLVGWVSEVDLSTCKVVTVLSPQTSVGAIDNRTSDTGIVSGSAKYCDDNLTTMSKLSADHKVKKGDIITSTGISGLYPKGLIIGEVVDICYDTYNTSYYAVIKPYDNIKEITELAIITDYTGQGEVLINEKSGKKK